MDMLRLAHALGILERANELRSIKYIESTKYYSQHRGSSFVHSSHANGFIGHERIPRTKTVNRRTNESPARKLLNVRTVDEIS